MTRGSWVFAIVLRTLRLKDIGTVHFWTQAKPTDPLFQHFLPIFWILWLFVSGVWWFCATRRKLDNRTSSTFRRRPSRASRSAATASTSSQERYGTCAEATESKPQCAPPSERSTRSLALYLFSRNVLSSLRAAVLLGAVCLLSPYSNDCVCFWVNDIPCV